MFQGDKAWVNYAYKPYDSPRIWLKAGILGYHADGNYYYIFAIIPDYPAHPL